MAIIGNIHKLENLLNQKELQPVFEYFKGALDPKSEIHKRIFALPVGSFERVELGNELFALEQVFFTKNRENCFIESHQKCIDFQLVLSGSEQMEYIDIGKLQVQQAYDSSKDLTIYTLVDNTSKFLLQKEDLAIFFPEDAHIGLPKFQKEECVYKTVIKFPLSKWIKS